MSILAFVGISIITTINAVAFGPFFYPNGDSVNDPISITFGEYNATHFYLNLDITGDHWFGFGFAGSSISGCTPSSLTDECQMSGTDAIIFGDYGGTIGLNAEEWTLGDHNPGTLQSNQDLTIASLLNQYSVSIHRPYDPSAYGDRSSYIITYPFAGTFCWLWAQGSTIDFIAGSSTHTRKGHECINFGGTTQPPTPSPSYGPTPGPTTDPTPKPTKQPSTDSDTAHPTRVPTSEPSKSPSAFTNSPSDEPSPSPTPGPTVNAGNPTKAPTLRPTVVPHTKQPTMTPITPAPTQQPSQSPTGRPTVAPTIKPTQSPLLPGETTSPTKVPTVNAGNPTKAPTLRPTVVAHTKQPTMTPIRPGPTQQPSQSPTGIPTVLPTVSPTIKPTQSPLLPGETASPTKAPTSDCITIMNDRFGPFYYPNGLNTDPVSITFGAFNTTHFVLNVETQSGNWFGFGFAASGIVKGYMQGTDAIIFGNWGGNTFVAAKEYTLSNHELGVEDDTLESSILIQGNRYSAEIIRAFSRNNRYMIPYPFEGQLCWIWAIGAESSINTASSHSYKGYECIKICSGSTDEPTPSPTSITSIPTQNTATPTINVPIANCSIGCGKYYVSGCDECICNKNAEIVSCQKSLSQCNFNGRSYCTGCNDEEQQCDKGNPVKRILTKDCKEFAECVDQQTNDQQFYSIMLSLTVITAFTVFV